MAAKNVTASEIVARVNSLEPMTRVLVGGERVLCAHRTEVDRAWLIRFVWREFGAAVSPATITTAFQTLAALAE